MKLGIGLALAMTLSLTTGSASASSIGVFSASDGTNCNFNAAAFSPFNIYVAAVLTGDVPGGGITGAELRCAGVDPAWYNTVVPAVGLLDLVGSPIDPIARANVAFPVCEQGGFVLLFTISSLPLSTPTPRTLRIVAGNPPSNPNLFCPLVLMCDANFTGFCVSGGEGFLNMAGAPPCTVAVERTSWTAVKSLYSR